MSFVFLIEEWLFKFMFILIFVDIFIIFIIGICLNKIYFVDNFILKSNKIFFYL